MGALHYLATPVNPPTVDQWILFTGTSYTEPIIVEVGPSDVTLDLIIGKYNSKNQACTINH